VPRRRGELHSPPPRHPAARYNESTPPTVAITLPAILRTLAQRWMAEVLFGSLAALCLLAAGYEIRNGSRSPAIGRYLVLALLSTSVAVLFHFLPAWHP
jgi:hypothetical protein